MNLTKQILTFTKDPHKRAFLLASSLFFSLDKKVSTTSINKSMDFAVLARESYATLLEKAKRDYQKDVHTKVGEYKKYLASLLQEARSGLTKKKDR